jgi:hypothetical protein
MDRRCILFLFGSDLFVPEVGQGGKPNRSEKGGHFCWLAHPRGNADGRTSLDLATSSPSVPSFSVQPVTDREFLTRALKVPRTTPIYLL